MRHIVRNRIADVWRPVQKILDNVRSVQRLTILNYHSVMDASAARVGCIAPEVFDSHINMLVERYNVLPLTNALEMVYSSSLPDRSVCITFDDGYVDNYENAFPTLVKYKCPATIFVVSDFIEGAVKLVDDARFGPMTWDQLREMTDSGLVEIQSHTKSHRIMSHLGEQDISIELNESKSTIVDNLGNRCDMIAYPNGQPGDFGELIEQATSRSGYQYAFSTNWERASRKSRTRAIPRIRIDPEDTTIQLKKKIEGHYDFVGIIQRARANLGIESTSANAGTRI